MSFSFKPDYDRVLQRFEAFWQRQIVDRPPVSIALPKPGAPSFQPRSYPSLREKWLDIDGRIDEMEAGMQATNYLADALPIAWPNLGPEILSACCGCGYEFGKTTAWSHPAIQDWERDFPKARLDMDHPLFQTLMEFTRRLLARGKGRYIVGLTDLHPGGDHVAALRGGQQLAMDLIEQPQWVRRALDRGEGEYYAVYGALYQMLRAQGMPATSWTPIVHEGTFYIPSNDFSCMVSQKMFGDFFLPGIRRECAFYERSIYHLDGPGALRHLDALLEIEELDAVQWVCGAGNEGYHKWVKVYQRIQGAGKGIQLMCDISELDMVFETLRPEGVWFSSISGIRDRETAQYAIKRIERWK
ncbi:MAG: hypothetical protein II697_06855 [Clostridia bacterium]|nr:hypothetical protein [Clostridia bacterium]